MISMSGMEGNACHALKVCSRGKCPDDAELKCDGKDYHTRQMLKCPMPVKLSAIKGLQSLNNLFTPFSNEATQTGLRHHTMFSYAFGQNIST